MRALFVSFVTVSAALAAGCSAHGAEDVASSEQAQISDVVSMTRRSDGRFDVVCRGVNGGPNRNEIATEAEIQSNTVCLRPLPPPPSTGHIVHGADRNIGLPDFLNNAEVEQWGRGLWEGFASFDVVLTGSEAGIRDFARLVDATGTSYEIKTTSTRFERLPLPVFLIATTDSAPQAIAQFTAVTFEVTRTNPIAAQAISGKYLADTVTRNVRSIGTDIPGVAMNLTLQARFYSNFTNGNACSRIIVIDNAGQTVTYQPTSTSRELTMIAPITIQSQTTCVSSRLASGENADADFDVAVSAITLGDPQ